MACRAIHSTAARSVEVRTAMLQHYVPYAAYSVTVTVLHVDTWVTHPAVAVDHGLYVLTSVHVEQ